MTRPPDTPRARNHVPSIPGAGPSTARLPWWLTPLNRLIVGLQRLGLAFFSFHLLSVPGRTSGTMRTTPVSPLRLADGTLYLVSIGQTQWVKNARVAGWGVLARGRRQQGVWLRELGLEGRRPIVRAFPVQIPHGVAFLVRVGAVAPPGDPDAFDAAAAQLAVFRVEPLGASTPQPAEDAARLA